jgi:hypothetical protein
MARIGGIVLHVALQSARSPVAASNTAGAAALASTSVSSSVDAAVRRTLSWSHQPAGRAFVWDWGGDNRTPARREARAAFQEATAGRCTPPPACLLPDSPLVHLHSWCSADSMAGEDTGDSRHIDQPRATTR